MDIEAAVLEAEDGAVVLHQDGEDLLLLGGVLSGASVNKNVLLPVVPMYVTAEPEFTFLLRFFNEQLGKVDGRVRLLRWLNPLPVQVGSRQITPVVAYDNSINIEHGHDFENKVVSEVFGSRVVAQEKLDDVLDDVGSHSFAGVHSGSEDDGLFVLQVVAVLADGQVVAAEYTRSYLLPASVRHRNFLWNRFFFMGSCSIVLRNLCSCV